MKSRLAVSLLFILIASTFAADATGAFEKLRSWTGKVSGRRAVQAGNCLTRRVSAWISTIGSDKGAVTVIQFDGGRLLIRQNFANVDQRRWVGTISPDGTTITFNSPDPTKLASSQERQTQSLVFKLVGSDNHDDTFKFITTAARQIGEVLDLMRTK